jgi:hypothetical protein
MYIPLNSGEAGMGQRFLTVHQDIQKLRDAWIGAIGKGDLALAAMYQVDLEKRRDQMVLYAIEQSEKRLANLIVTSFVVAAIALAAFHFFVKG